MQDTTKTNFRVGAFVFAALALVTMVTFLIGDSRGYFGSKTNYFSIYQNVGGLRAGSTLRMAGVDVGTVGKVSLQPDGKIKVIFHVVNKYVTLIRNDSAASIGSKGMLGDKLVDISVGHGNPIPADGEIRAVEPSDMSDMMAQAGNIVHSTKAVMDNLENATGLFADDAFQADARAAVKNLNTILEMAANGNGLARKVLTDENFAHEVDQTLVNAKNASAEIARASANARSITDEVREGHGSVHEIIYGQAGAELTRNLANATGEAASLMHAARTERGTVHQLIYEDGARPMIDNANAMSTDLRAIVADLRAGHGTLGAFLQDPSVYEDVKRIVGNLERNEILHALVRYTIRHDDHVRANVTEHQEAPAQH